MWIPPHCLAFCSLYDLRGHEWIELAMAFAYGQRITKRDLEEIREFRKHYRRLLEREAEQYSAEKARKG